MDDDCKVAFDEDLFNKMLERLEATISILHQRKKGWKKWFSNGRVEREIMNDHFDMMNYYIEQISIHRNTYYFTPKQKEQYEKFVSDVKKAYAEYEQAFK